VARAIKGGEVGPNTVRGQKSETVCPYGVRSAKTFKGKEDFCGKRGGRRTYNAEGEAFM